MLKLKKKKDSEVKYDAVTDEADDTQKFIEDFVADLFKTNPDLADKLAGPLLTKSVLDNALDNGVYRVDEDEVLETLTTKAGAKKQNKGSRGHGKKTPDSKRKVMKGKGLKKPHTSI